jgi:hypothetical protein
VHNHVHPFGARIAAPGLQSQALGRIQFFQKLGGQSATSNDCDLHVRSDRVLSESIAPTARPHAATRTRRAGRVSRHAPWRTCSWRATAQGTNQPRPHEVHEAADVA